MKAIAKNGIEDELYSIKEGDECDVVLNLIGFRGCYICELGSDFQEENFRIVN